MFKNHCLFDRFFYACKTQVINQMGTKSACKGLAKNCTIYITFPRILANSRVMCQRNLATKYSTLFQPLQQLLAKWYSYQKRFSFNYIFVKKKISRNPAFNKPGVCRRPGRSIL